MNLKLIFSLLVCGPSLLLAQDVWTVRDSVNGAPKSACVSFVANGQGYLLTGREASSFTRKMYSYDILQNDWDNEQSLGGDNGSGLSRGSACAFSIDNKGYITTGQGDNANFLNDTWEYDPIADVWTQKADFIGSARRGAVSFVINAIGYVGTGEDASGLKKDFFKFDPVTNVWGVIADFAGTPRKKAVAFSMGSVAYVGTGDDGVFRNDLWEYQVFQNIWVQRANLAGAARAGAVAWVNFPNAYIATGEDINFNYSNEVWEYNYFNNQWTQRASLPAAGRKDATAFVINGIAFLGTGYDGTNLLDDFYAYQGIVGIEENTNQTGVHTFPNPATNAFSIAVDAKRMHDAEIVFYTVDGREANASFSVQKNDAGFVVTSNNLAKGMYYFLIRNGADPKTYSGSIVLH